MPCLAPCWSKDVSETVACAVGETGRKFAIGQKRSSNGYQEHAACSLLVCAMVLQRPLVISAALLERFLARLLSHELTPSDRQGGAYNQ